MIKHIDNEILQWKLILNLPHVPVDIIILFEDETLNLMAKMTLLLTKRPNRTVNDFKIDFYV